MAIVREDIRGASGVISNQEYTKDVSSLVGQGTIGYADHSAPAIDTVLTVLGWPGMKVTERTKRIDSDTWSSGVTVRDPILDKLSEPLLSHHVFISAGFNVGIGEIVPENQKDQVEIHERGGDNAEDEAWTAIDIAEFLALHLDIPVMFSVLDYTVSKIEFSSGTTYLDVLSQFFDMYRPRIFVSGGTLFILDRLAGAIGPSVTLNAKAKAIEQREQREPMPRSIKVTGASTSRSNLLKEKQTKSFSEAIGDYRFVWQGYGYETLVEYRETEMEKVETTFKFGLDVDGNRQYLVREDTKTWKRESEGSSLGWRLDSEESTFHMHVRTSNMWEAPRLEFSVEVLSTRIWRRIGTEGAFASFVEEKLNSEYGWVFGYRNYVSYVFHRYLYGDTPYVGRLKDADGTPISYTDAVDQPNQPSVASRSTHFEPTTPDFRVFGGSVGNPQSLQPNSFAVFGGPLSLGGTGRQMGGSDTGSLTGGDLLLAEITTYKAILICKTSHPAAPDGSKCFVPAFKLDPLTVFNEDSRYYDSGTSEPPSSSMTKEQKDKSYAGGAPRGGKASPHWDQKIYESLVKDALAKLKDEDAPDYSGPGDSVPGGFSDDFFNQFRTAIGSGPPVWGSHIKTYMPLTDDTHLEREYSVFYDESIDVMKEKNNVNVESAMRMVGSPNPTAPLRKKRVLATWSANIETLLDGLGDGPAVVVSNPAIATKEDADAIANRLKEIYARGNRQYTTVVLTADLVPDVGWGVSGTVSHPNGPSLTVGSNGIITGFSKQLDPANASRIVQLTVESDA